MKYLTKAQVIQMMEQYWRGSTREIDRMPADPQVAPHLRYGTGIYHAPFGTKIGLKRVGAVLRWYIYGYSSDNSDVTQALATIGA